MAASVILLLLGIWAVGAITEGFKVITSEQARRLEISRKQPAVPDMRLIDQAGQMFRFGEWVKEKNKFLIVDFIYTNCQSLCRALGTEFQQLQRNVVERGLQDRVQLLSVSFDPVHDSHAVLRQYADRLQATPDIWTFATVGKASDLDALLRTFGVTVIPDRQGGFQHNAALVWVAPSGKLVRVTDYDASDHLSMLDELAGSN
ncbi:MAG: SCO family protein [Nitrosomonadales bacterium]|nr:SCO family protein [Nitrosomonadales bacterium]